ncbi:MAG: alcohol dehydrogenase catalytic domain-containing protein [Lachnospiraceae bacterium]|nr:alcohol dehydrogenase catalytic domain-containing protein [Lachnospiraceae bacterium]
MVQQIMYHPHQVSFHNVPVPQAGAGEVLIKMHMIGICGSDIHVYHGTHPFTPYPVTQGHEISGEIVEVGEGVEQFSKGQKVTVEPQVVCGKCYPCRHGKYNLCENLKVMGFQTTGMASTFFAVDAKKVTPLPQEMDYKAGAMIEPLAVAVHAVNRMGDISGMKVAVLGAGPIGNLVAQAAKAKGAESVLITDVSDYRLGLARQVGIDFTVNTREKNFGEAMLECFGPDKADVIYDCAGNDVTMGQAIQYARKGSTIILVAVFAGMAKVDLAVLNDHELDLNTTMMYRHEDYVQAIDMAASGNVKLEPLQSKVFAFAEYQQAYEYIDANRETTMKVLIDVQA